MSKIVFISYSRANAVIAEQLRYDLEAQGIKIWIDHEQIVPGTPDWDAAIRRGIQAANVVIYLASPEALASPYVGGELVVADRFGKSIIPVWVAGEHWADSAPLNYIRAQYLDARQHRYQTAYWNLCQQLGVGLRKMPPGLAAPPLVSQSETELWEQPIRKLLTSQPVAPTAHSPQSFSPSPLQISSSNVQSSSSSSATKLASVKVGRSQISYGILLSLGLVLTLVLVVATIRNASLHFTQSSANQTVTQTASSQAICRPSPTATSTGLSISPATLTAQAQIITPNTAIALIENGGFENGSYPWVECSAGGHELIDDTIPHSGKNSGDLCGYSNCQDILGQGFIVPSQFSTIKLSYYWDLITNKTSSNCLDSLTATIYLVKQNGTLGNAVTQVQQSCNNNATSSYKLQMTDVTSTLKSFAGQTLSLIFSGQTDSTASTFSRIFIDDVTLEAN